jgi:hypothetical protein
MNQKDNKTIDHLEFKSSTPPILNIYRFFIFLVIFFFLTLYQKNPFAFTIFISALLLLLIFKRAWNIEIYGDKIRLYRSEIFPFLNYFQKTIEVKFHQIDYVEYEYSRKGILDHIWLSVHPNTWLMGGFTGYYSDRITIKYKNKDWEDFYKIYCNTPDFTNAVTLINRKLGINEDLIKEYE